MLVFEKLIYHFQDTLNILDTFAYFQTTYKFIGHKTRTKEQLQSLMYCEEMETWLAEERLEEARTQARYVFT